MSALPELDRELRAEGIGASEIGAIAGLSPYATALDIYCRKLGLVEDSAFDSPAARWGLRKEPIIAEAYTEETGIALVGDGRKTYRHPGHPWMLATPDRIATDGSRIVEIKTASSRQAAFWGDTETDEVPQHFLGQTTWQCLVLGISKVDIVLLMDQCDFRIYHLEFDAELGQSLFEMGREFWHENVLARVPPEPTTDAALGRYLAAKYPRNSAPLKGASAEAELYAAALRDVRAERKYLEEKEERLALALKEEIGDADGLVTSIGEVTWKSPKPRAIVDWETVARNCDPSAELIAAHTSLAKASRRFLVKF